MYVQWNVNNIFAGGWNSSAISTQTWASAQTLLLDARRTRGMVNSCASNEISVLTTTFLHLWPDSNVCVCVLARVNNANYHRTSFAVCHSPVDWLALMHFASTTIDKIDDKQLLVCTFAAIIKLLMKLCGVRRYSATPLLLILAKWHDVSRCSWNRTFAIVIRVGFDVAKFYEIIVIEMKIFQEFFAFFRFVSSTTHQYLLQSIPKSQKQSLNDSYWADEYIRITITIYNRLLAHRSIEARAVLDARKKLVMQRELI